MSTMYRTSPHDSLSFQNVRFMTTPKVLLVNLKRYYVDAGMAEHGKREGEKLNHQVEIPRLLDMCEFAVVKENCIYEIWGYTIHGGGTGGGHWVCFFLFLCDVFLWCDVIKRIRFLVGSCA